MNVGTIFFYFSNGFSKMMTWLAKVQKILFKFVEMMAKGCGMQQKESCKTKKKNYEISFNLQSMNENTWKNFKVSFAQTRNWKSRKMIFSLHSFSLVVSMFVDDLLLFWPHKRKLFHCSADGNHKYEWFYYGGGANLFSI